jgi:hypothetical protein
LTSGGPVGIKDIDKLIKVLTLQKEPLADDEPVSGDREGTATK